MSRRCHPLLLRSLRPLLLAAVFLISCPGAQAQQDSLLPLRYQPLPLGTIQPTGWLHGQLERMAGGLTGRLDELYPSVMGDRNGWLGGDGDGWERGPYWIDGLLPLAYQLDNDTLKQKAQRWIDWTLDHQAEDGYFGPAPFAERPAYEPGLQRGNRRDWWPKTVMLKVLQQYYGATQDPRVIDVLTRYFRYQLGELPSRPLDADTFWAGRRGGDNLMVVYWLHGITGEDFLLDLADLLVEQTFPWDDVFQNPPDSDPEPAPWSFFKMKSYPYDSAEIAAVSVADMGNIHTVNLAHGVKQPALLYRRTGELRYLEAIYQGLETLRKYHGQVQGMYGGDEPLHGNKPVQGVEFCSVSEKLFSLETILQISGDISMADLAERIAYNALPTQASDDFLRRQYFQTANQVELRAYSGVSFENHNHRGTDFVFGMLTGYPCCTANMHQAWPKFVQNLFYATPDGGVAALLYGPSTARLTVAGDIPLTVTETTGYPFRETVTFTLDLPRPATFPFHLRIPDWAGEAKITVNGSGVAYELTDGIAILDREWSDGDRIDLTLPMQLRTSTWYENSTAIERGPLVYALRIGERREEVDRDDGYGPFTEVYATMPWNYGLVASTLDSLGQHAEVIERPWDGDAYPWNLEGSPVEIRLPGIRMREWEAQNGVPHLPAFWGPYTNYAASDRQEITLIPYGCTTLRIAQFPTVSPGKPAR